ncbi:MAG TPA: hypothetical protein VKG20_11995 [Methylomirabilota bacterium]|nr:hypothetical protein [Methylomirabilota bacterium]
MSVTPNPDDREPTVAMSAQDLASPSLSDITRFIAASKRARRRRLMMYAGIAIVFIAAAATGWFLFRLSETRLAASVGISRAVVRPEVAQPFGPPAAPPPRAPAKPDKSAAPRQMLAEIFEGRDRGHSVTASIERGAVRIGSSRPGYVYVLAASTSQSDGATLFVGVLYPRASDTNNRVRPGQTLKLPDFSWPTNAEFLAIVSDQPREIDVLGALAGKVVCASKTPCSESYGAAVFSSEGMPSRMMSSEGVRGLPRGPAAPKAPATRPTPAVSRRCSDILERASLGEALTDQEQTFLRRDCR